MPFHPSIDPTRTPHPDNADTIALMSYTDPVTGMELTAHYDQRLVHLNFGLKCSHMKAEDIRVYSFPAADFLAGIDVKPETLRELANEMDAKKSWPDLSTDELITKGMDKINFRGKTVLDIGGFDGRFAKMAHDRGARRAVCLDNQQWTEYGWQQPPFSDEVEYITGDFRDWSEPFDIVLFLNVLYHVESPITALQHLTTICDDKMLICSLGVWSDLPVWRPFEPREVNPDDVTVFWGPSPGGLRKGLTIAGWSDYKEIGRSHERMVYLAYR